MHQVAQRKKENNEKRRCCHMLAYHFALKQLVMMNIKICHASKVLNQITASSSETKSLSIPDFFLPQSRCWVLDFLHLKPFSKALAHH